MGLPPPRPLRKKRPLVPPPTSGRIFPNSLRPGGYLLPGQLDVPMGLPPPRPLRKKRPLVPPPTGGRIFPNSLRPGGYLLPGQLDVPMGLPPPRPLRKKRPLVPPPTGGRIFPNSLRPCGYLLPGQPDVPTGLPPPRPSGKRTLVGTSSRRRAFFSPPSLQFARRNLASRAIRISAGGEMCAPLVHSRQTARSISPEDKRQRQRQKRLIRRGSVNWLEDLAGIPERTILTAKNRSAPHGASNRPIRMRAWRKPDEQATPSSCPQ